MNVRHGESNEWHQQNAEKDGAATVQFKVSINLVPNFGKIKIFAIMLLPVSVKMGISRAPKISVFNFFGSLSLYNCQWESDCQKLFLEDLSFFLNSGARE